jgi:hypothetical protein
VGDQWTTGAEALAIQQDAMHADSEVAAEIAAVLAGPIPAQVVRTAQIVLVPTSPSMARRARLTAAASSAKSAPTLALPQTRARRPVEIGNPDSITRRRRGTRGSARRGDPVGERRAD